MNYLLTCCAVLLILPSTHAAQNSLIADPLFVDPTHGDVRFQPGSPASQIRFESWDFSAVGPAGFSWTNPIDFSYFYFDGTREKQITELRDPAIIREGSITGVTSWA